MLIVQIFLVLIFLALLYFMFIFFNATMLFNRKFEKLTERLTSIEELVSRMNDRDSRTFDSEASNIFICETRDQLDRNEHVLRSIEESVSQMNDRDSYRLDSEEVKQIKFAQIIAKRREEQETQDAVDAIEQIDQLIESKAKVDQFLKNYDETIEQIRIRREKEAEEAKIALEQLNQLIESKEDDYDSR